ncbi:MAG: hypothetical protein KAG12_00615 [Desulfuromusa sp.]|nr:hypothetical protein [Desulfuromusa sp.]
MQINSIPIMTLCFIAAMVCVIQMSIHLKGKGKKEFNTFLPFVFAEYLATTLEEKGRPGMWLIAFVLFAFVFIFIAFAQLIWSIKTV